MSRSCRLERGMLAAMTLSLSLSLQGCTGGDGGTRQRPKPADVIALARSYQFVNPTGPVPAVNPLPSGTGEPSSGAPVVITIERAVPIVSPSPSGYVILARVRSDKPYKHLGIEAGDNYIWRDETAKHYKNWVTYMVPANPASTPSKLKRSTDQFSTGEHTEPRLVRTVVRSAVAFGACLDDPKCGSGHCGYGDVD